MSTTATGSLTVEATAPVALPPSARTEVLVALTVLRVVQLGSWPLAAATGGTLGVRSFAIAVALWTLAALGAAAALVLLWSARTRTAGTVAPGAAVDPAAVRRRIAVVLDASVAVGALLGGGLVTRAGYGTGFSHPTLALAIGAALTVALSGPVRRSLLVLAGLVLAYLLGIVTTLALGSVALTAVAAGVLELAVLPPVVAFLVGRLGRSPDGRPTADQAAQAARTEREMTAVRARDAERARQYRVVHDTVLSSLSALSRGSLDPREPEIRQRLAADADYLRGLIATSGSAAGMRLVGELARLTREQAPLGLRVHPHIADVPDELPTEVVEAVTGAVGESLHNVIKHSRTREAWVTMVGDPDHARRLVVSVTDRGVGFDPAQPGRGLGLRQSVVARMGDVGGAALLDSSPGQGTTIELRWPR